MMCLALLATAGAEADWNDCRRSKGHFAIPLPSEAGVAGIPMIAQLIRQLGLEVRAVLSSDVATMVDAEEKAYNVFYVPEAAGSPHIPAQAQFVLPYGVRSVLGFGGLLQSGHMFATILFTRVAVPRPTAEMFRTLTLSAKVALTPFSSDRVFL